jgi:hypothetical protein
MLASMYIPVKVKHHAMKRMGNLMELHTPVVLPPRKGLYASSEPVWPLRG